MGEHKPTYNWEAPQCTNDWWTFVRTICTLYIFCIYRYWEWIQSCFEFWEFTWTPNSFPSLREYLHSWSYIWAFWGCSMHRNIETYSTRSSPVFFWTMFHIQLPHHQTSVQFVFLNSALFASLSPQNNSSNTKPVLNINFNTKQEGISELSNSWISIQ